MGRLLALVLLAVSCQERIEVLVSCRGTETGGVMCTLENKSGKKAGACWDIEFPCANGAKVYGSHCGEVEGGATASVLMPDRSIRGVDSCDSVTGAAVKNVRVVRR